MIKQKKKIANTTQGSSYTQIKNLLNDIKVLCMNFSLLFTLQIYSFL